MSSFFLSLSSLPPLSHLDHPPEDFVEETLAASSSLSFLSFFSVFFSSGFFSSVGSVGMKVSVSVRLAPLPGKAEGLLAMSFRLWLEEFACCFEYICCCGCCCCCGGWCIVGVVGLGAE